MAQPPQDNDDLWQPRIPREKTWWVLAGLLLVILLAALDQTIVSTALPSITADLHGADRYSWVATTYLLASTVTIPLYGKLSDLFGRKRILLFGIVIFLLGSAWCGAAQTMNQLIIARGFQGLGAGALIPVVFAAMADLFSPRERGRYQGLTGGVFGLASVVGPLVGGWITDNMSWRYVFYVNLPVGLVAAAVLVFLMPTLGSRKPAAKIDFAGAFLLVAALAPLILSLDWVGAGSGLLSMQVVLPLVTGTIIIAVFVRHALRAPEPIVDLRLFGNPIVSISSAVVLVNGAVMIGTTFFIPFFVQGILGQSASTTGNIMTPMMLAMITASITSGQLVSRLGKYKLNAIAGAVIANVGLLLMLRLGVGSGSAAVILATVITGLGIGAANSIYSTAVQNAVPFSKMGQASAKVTLSRQIGGTMGLSFMASLMHFHVVAGKGMVLDAAAKASFAAGFHTAYICVFCLSLVATVLALNLKEIPLRHRPDGK